MFQWRSHNHWRRTQFPRKGSCMNNLISKVGLISKTSGCGEWISGVKYLRVRVVRLKHSCALATLSPRTLLPHAIIRVRLQTHFEALDCKICEWSQEDHQQRFQKKSLHSRRSCTERNMFFITRRRGVDDLWVLQSQRHRRIRLGFQWNLAGRLDAWQRTVVQYATGWIHIAMRKQPHEEFLDNWNNR